MDHMNATGNTTALPQQSQPALDELAAAVAAAAVALAAVTAAASALYGQEMAIGNDAGADQYSAIVAAARQATTAVVDSAR